MRSLLLLGFFLMQFAQFAISMPITNPTSSVANIADPPVLNVRIAKADPPVLNAWATLPLRKADPIITVRPGKIVGGTDVSAFSRTKDVSGNNWILINYMKMWDGGELVALLRHTLSHQNSPRCAIYRGSDERFQMYRNRPNAHGCRVKSRTYQYYQQQIGYLQ